MARFASRLPARPSTLCRTDSWPSRSAVGCSDSEPTTSSDTTVVVPAGDALEAERAQFQAELNAVQAPAEIDSLRAALEAAESRPAAAPARSALASSTAPGLRGLPPAGGAPELFSGSKPSRFCETYRQSTAERYEGRELCHEGAVRQNGDKLTGSGRKSNEDGRALTGSARASIEIEGYVYNG